MSKGGKEIRIGFIGNLYLTPFQKGVVPYLQEKGYHVTPVEFNSEVEVNKALEAGKIDASVNFSPAELSQSKSTLLPVFSVPTVPVGLYSSKHTSLKEVKEGMTVYVPAEEEAYTRSLLQLSGLNWISFDGNGDGKAPVQIQNNVKGVQLVKYQGESLQDLLNKGDFVLASGSFALTSGKKFEDALALEQVPPRYLTALTVKKENKDLAFVKDLQDAYHSSDFKSLLAAKEYQLYAKPVSSSGLPDCCVLVP